MQKVSSWRELLDIIVSNPAERTRIATEIGIRPITLTRWANGETKPRADKLRLLLQALPKDYHDQFQKLLEQEFPGLFYEEIDDKADELPYTFVREVLETRANSPDLLQFWAISRQILQHALKKLDPLSLGLAITVAQCMPPSQDGKIRSLRERTGVGTPPWPINLDEQGMFLGAESLAGYATKSFHYAKIDDLRVEKSLLPAYQAEHEVSAVAYPLMYAQRVVGCLLISSTQPEYFNSPARLALIQGYAHLMSLAFEPEEFYPAEQIEFFLMPAFSIQRTHFQGFRQRVVEIMKTSTTAAHPLTSIQAEQLAWQQIEEILCQPFFE
jgi:transcriptional regulator with XRE-family HTH domain